MHVGAGVFMPVAATSLRCFASRAVAFRVTSCVTFFASLFALHFASHSAPREMAVPYAMPR